MLKRLGTGPLKGAIIGGVVAAVLGYGLGVTELRGVLAYLAAAACGFLTGILAGKPVWATSAKTEATLKAIVGGAMAAGILFVLRRFIRVPVNLGLLGAGNLLDLPRIVLPALGALLALIFDIDDAVGRSHDTPERPQ